MSPFLVGAKMTFRALLAITAAGFLLTGCASIIKGTSQSILITTPPTTEAYCILASSQGNWTVNTPGAVTISKSKENVTITCTKDGWQQAVASIPSEFEGWTVGNILFGGLIGVGVDAATGAINNYPNAFQVPMTPLPAGTVATVSSPRAVAPAIAPAVRTVAVRPSLGIVGGTVTENSTGPSVYLPDPYGAWVDGVAPRSPAAVAGVRQGDIVRTFNGHRVSTFEELDAFAVETIPGSRVTLGIYRNGQMIEVELDL
jgi:S1-C subfamily serine protease